MFLVRGRKVLALSLFTMVFWASTDRITQAEWLDDVNEARNDAGLTELMDAKRNNKDDIIEACTYDLQLLSDECERGISPSCAVGLRVKQACMRAITRSNPSIPVMPHTYTNPDAAARFCYGGCIWHYAMHECVCK